MVPTLAPAMWQGRGVSPSASALHNYAIVLVSFFLMLGLRTEDSLI